MKINMVMFGPCNWAFEQCIAEYKKYSAHEIIVSRVPVKDCDIYQYWRPACAEAIRTFAKFPHWPYLNNSIHMVHESPYDKGRANTNERIKYISRFTNVLCTSQEQVDFYSNHHDNVHLCPLGVFDGFEPKKTYNIDKPIRIGFCARLYPDGVKGEALLSNIAVKLNNEHFEFVISSPQHADLARLLRLKNVKVIEHSEDVQKNSALTDVHLILSKREGTPLPLIENLSRGNHILSTSCGVAPEILDKSCICSDADAFVTKLNEIYLNRNILKHSLNHNPKLVKDRTWKNHVRAMEKLWHETKETQPSVIKDPTKTIAFLSWHNSLPRNAATLYKLLPFNKIFVSFDQLKHLQDPILMSDALSYIVNTDEDLLSLLKAKGVTHVLVWNGSFDCKSKGYQIKTIDKLKSLFEFRFIEHGWLSQADHLSIDSIGACGYSSLVNVKDYSCTTSVVDKRNEYISKVKEFYVNDYIYVPLQLNDDTQIKLHSPHFDNMKQFVQHVITLFPNNRILVKAHPKDTAERKNIYRRICRKYSNVIFKDDTENITYCYHCKCVVSINSTVVNEALLFDKPVMTYGRGIFNNKDVTYHIDDITNTQKQIGFLSWKPDHEKIRQYISMLLDHQYSASSPDIDKIVNRYFT